MTTVTLYTPLKILRGTRVVLTCNLDSCEGDCLLLDDLQPANRKFFAHQSLGENLSIKHFVPEICLFRKSSSLLPVKFYRYWPPLPLTCLPLPTSPFNIYMSLSPTETNHPRPRHDTYTVIRTRTGHGDRKCTWHRHVPDQRLALQRVRPRLKRLCFRSRGSACGPL